MIAGALWELGGPSSTFFAGAIFTVRAILALLFVHRLLVERGTANDS
jgi:hypothetical protein